jgi:hypothetical protein
MVINFSKYDGASSGLFAKGSIDLNSLDKAQSGDGFSFKMSDPLWGNFQIVITFEELQQLAMLANDLFIEIQKEQ